MTINFCHTHDVIPNTIAANKELFLNEIFPSVENMKSFIRTTYNKANDNASNLEVEVLSTINNPNTRMVTIKFYDNYALEEDDALFIAFTLRDGIMRYFVLENNNNKYSVKEISLDDLTSRIYETFEESNEDIFIESLFTILDSSKKVKVGVSNRHVHLCKEDLETLFGHNYELEFERALVQKGEFAAKEKVTIKTDVGEIPNVRVLGPVRNYTQVEISKTDAYKLKINPPIRESGDLEGTAPITIVGPVGTVNKESNCIIANRHIHVNEGDLLKYNLDVNKTYMVRAGGPKGGVLDNVHLKLKDSYSFEFHIDTDDANAFLIKTGDELEIIEK